MKELLNQFAQVPGELLETLAHYPAGRITEKVFGNWDIKCVLAHLAGWDLFFTDIVKRLRAGVEVPYWGDIDQYNQSSVEQRQGNTWSQVYDEFVQAGEAFIEAYEHLEETLWDRRLWEQASYTPAWIVEINIEHYETHQAGIEKSLMAWQE